MKKARIVVIFTLVGVIIAFLYCTQKCNNAATAPLTLNDLKVELGRNIFFDRNLSNPVGQSCSSCHAASAGFSDSTHAVVSKGAVAGIFGNRNAPIAAYSMFTPAFHYDKEDSSFAGGLFLDGRANTLEEQFKMPLLNKLEMNNDNIAMVVSKLKNADYLPLFKRIYGEITDTLTAFGHLADAVAAFERSPELNPFTSKFDYYLKGEVALTAEELNGLHLFNDTLKSKCTKCHFTEPDKKSGKVLFTDFTYNNNGVPKNPNNPFYNIPIALNPAGTDYIDKGLGDILHDPGHDGEFRVSSLRNIAISAPYFHNGVFNTLEEVVHFYNVRDVAGSGIAPPEVAANMETEETGNLHMTQQEEKDIVAFLKTLTDGYAVNK